MVVGGGTAVDDIRRQQVRWRLSDEQAHWLAIEAMSTNARHVAAKLAAGAPGKRLALPNARVLLHQPYTGAQGQVSDLEIASSGSTAARTTTS